MNAAAGPSIGTMDQWVAVAEGFGTNQEHARADAERNLAAFLRAQGVMRSGEIWMHSVDRWQGRQGVTVVVKCRVGP